MKWETYKQWPQLFPWFDLELDTTDDELAWMQMHQHIDAGIEHCSSCDTFGRGTFCGGCGRRFHGQGLPHRECPTCRSRFHLIREVSTDYCSLCGTLVASEFLKRMERGEVDWAAESQMATDMLHRIIQRRPELAEDLARGYGGKPDLMTALKTTFGERSHA